MDDFFSPRSGHRVSETQQDSYHSITVGELTAKQKMVMDCFDSPMTLLTREDISARTNLKLSSVCGRARELLDAGRLVKRGSRKCIATGKSQELLGLPVA
ncbi:hypothetical protein [Burkholderia stagnalis]|uniref:MarR family transcriptional regulator n=1 Tax=Burkholderia stagnalis TaxID=1503054 RepID=A0ABX9YTJ4_9BURK|nr:hypothetical protein [Burkholderia stagnalis]MBR7961219.1 hypothetical protein [Burkholderia vietnamiensis]RQQ64386.1 hypothetical protein DF158_06165 [Burkholderia stagnalis]RQR03777.1 hypothetical protein DF025_31570 [Burkholderia stagnalis]RQR12573.1 hypothetical protein DF026_32445 [Burkholderia stagnalis]RQR15265.1 hypothetical protein DF021_06165 [Burkholderia stagnalis]